jgi:hypothetical protein
MLARMLDLFIAGRVPVEVRFPKPSPPLKTLKCMNKARLDVTRAISDFQLRLSKDTEREIDDMEKKVKLLEVTTDKGTTGGIFQRTNSLF